MEIHDSRTDPPPGTPPPGPSPEDLEELLQQVYTEEDIQLLLEIVFGLIAARRAIRDPVTHKLVWDMEEPESKRIAHWAARVANKRAWLRKLAEWFPEIMLAATLTYAGWKRYAREQEILEWLKEQDKQRKANTPAVGEAAP